MEKIDLLVNGSHFFTMQGEGVGYRTETAMAVDRGRILTLGPAAELTTQYEAARTIEAPHHMVLPGFIDIHMHIADCIFRGLAQDTANWMMYGLAPFFSQLDEEAMLLGAKLAVYEAVRAGTTTFGEFSRKPDEIIKLFIQTGVRGRVTPTIREAVTRIYHPGELYEYDPDRGRLMLNECLDIRARWDGAGDGRVTVLFGPQGPDFVSKDLLLEIQRLAKEADCMIHMHTQQGDRETAQTMMRYEKRPIAWLDEIGFLDERLLAVHLTDANDDEAALVAKRGASMALCSGSIGIIDGIVPPAKAFQDAGGNVGLGSDQSPGNNNHNIINEMKLTALFNKIRYQDPEVMPAWKVLRMATIEGARAMGLGDQIGSLEEGKRADLIMVDLRAPTMAPVISAPMRNMVPNLVYAARGDEVCMSVVDGKVIYENGKLTGLDWDELLPQLETKATELAEKATDEFNQIDGTNSQFMRAGKL
jgi:5-methylthioadenosine/S-adenosylhomocysteine deaminase